MFTMSICMRIAVRLLGLVLDADPRRQVQLHEGVERLLRRLEDVEEPLVRADLELLPRLLVDVRRAEHGELVDLGGQRHGAGHAGARALRRVHDLARRLVEQAVIVGLQTNSDFGSHVLNQPLVVADLKFASDYSAYYFLASLGSSGRILLTTPAPTVLP